MTYVNLALPQIPASKRPFFVTAGPRIFALASFELRSTLRGKMILAFAVLFAVVAVGLAVAGLGGSGRLLVQGFTRTSVSLMTLGLYMLPLLGLLLGAMAFADRSGAMEAMAAQPIGAADIVLGRALGLAASVVLVVLAGFGSAGFFIAMGAGFLGIGGFMVVAMATALVGIAGLAVGILIGVAARSRLGAAGGAMAAWLFAAVVYDLLAIGILQLAGDGEPAKWLVAVLALNPIDGVRAVALVELGADVLLGPAGAALERLFGGAGGIWLVAASLAAWVAGPLALAISLHARRDR